MSAHSAERQNTEDVAVDHQSKLADSRRAMPSLWLPRPQARLHYCVRNPWATPLASTKYPAISPS